MDWISVHDMRPQQDERCLIVYIINGIEFIGIGTMDDKGKWKLDHHGKCLVTHWMPLPELPYKRWR